MIQSATNNRPRRNLSPYLFLSPALIMMGIFLFYPIMSVFSMSFTNYNLASKNDFVGLGNFQNLLSLDVRPRVEGQTIRQTIPAGYQQIAQVDFFGQRYVISGRDPDFWRALRNSFFYLLATPVLIVLSIIVAVLVNRPLRGIGFFRAGYYIPAITSVVAIGLMWRTLYQQDGLINQFLTLIGLKPVGWLTEPGLTLLSAMIVTVWRGVGYYAVIFLAGLQGIPLELYEAAAIDGANRWQQHWNITLPGLRPSILFVAVVSSISALRAFDEVYVVAGKSGGVLNSARTVILYIYNQFDARLIGYAAAISVVFFVITVALSIINLRFGDRRTGGSEQV